MEIAITFAALVVGWALGLLTQLWRERREARNAARIVFAELLGNLSRLHAAHEAGEWDEAAGFSHSGWDAHGLVLLRVLDDGALTDLTRAYRNLNFLEPYLPDAVYKKGGGRHSPELHLEYDYLLGNAINALRPYAGYASHIHEFTDAAYRERDIQIAQYREAATPQKRSDRQSLEESARRIATALEKLTASPDERPLIERAMEDIIEWRHLREREDPPTSD